VAKTLSPFSLLSSSRKQNKQFAVIGLGRFGRAVCGTLHALGYEVMGTDKDPKRVDDVLNDRLVSHALQLDSTESSALKEAGIFEFDTVIVAIGNFLQESIITTLNVKEAGVANVVAKASSDIHGKLLEKVGADRVIYPEHEAGCTLARSLTKPAILDRLDLDDNCSIVEIVIPQQFDGKTIGELQLRNHYGLNAIAIGSNGKFDINPTPERRLHKDEVMVAVGMNEDIEKLPI
jgi:trk system potassium uptake protein